MSMTFDQKQQQLKGHFADCQNRDARYMRIIELGRELGALPAEQQIPANIVQGCQSTMYLHTECRDGRLYFSAQSDAMISAGLAVLLINVYSGETPETVMTVTPDYLEELGITASLSPNRANGLYSLHLRMKQEALKALVP